MRISYYKNAKRSKKLTAVDCFAMGFRILGRETIVKAGKLAERLKTIYLYMAGAWVYNKTYFYKVPLLWLLGAVNFVIAFMPITATSVESHGNHIFANMMFLSIWLMFSATDLSVVENEDEEEQKKRERRLKAFLRKFYKKEEKRNEKRRNVA